jgi:hypothetical protein
LKVKDNFLWYHSLLNPPKAVFFFGESLINNCRSKLLTMLIKPL